MGRDGAVPLHLVRRRPVVGDKVMNDDDEKDRLRPARGILNGLILGALVWAVLIALVSLIMFLTGETP
jgi:hypothetical protein